jgi:hypothetical protein
MHLPKRVVVSLKLDELSADGLDDLAARIDAHEAEAPRFWLWLGIRQQDEVVRRLRYQRGNKPVGGAPPVRLPRMTPDDLDAAFKSLEAAWCELRPVALDTDTLEGAQARALLAVVGQLSRAVFSQMRLVASQIADGRLAAMRAASMN